jgi:hypothetical protein
MYRYPNEDEIRFQRELIGSKIEIYWDGDEIFYPALVTEFDESTGLHTVLYDNDDTNEAYKEDLSSTKWKLFDESATEEADEEKIKVGFSNQVIPRRYYIINIPMFDYIIERRIEA